MRLLHNFMVEELRLSVAREIFVATFYFAAASGKFIPRLQINSKPDDVMWKCQAAAWDLILLRLPELLLVNGSNEPVPLAYVCTGERALQKIGHAWILMHIKSLPPNPHIPTTAIIPNYLEFTRMFPESTIVELDELQAESSLRLQASRTDGVINHIKEADLSTLTSALEGQIRSMTRR